MGHLYLHTCIQETKQQHCTTLLSEFWCYVYWLYYPSMWYLLPLTQARPKMPCIFTSLMLSAMLSCHDITCESVPGSPLLFYFSAGRGESLGMRLVILASWLPRKIRHASTITNQNWAQFLKAQLTPYKLCTLFPTHLQLRELCHCP